MNVANFHEAANFFILGEIDPLLRQILIKYKLRSTKVTFIQCIQTAYSRNVGKCYMQELLKHCIIPNQGPKLQNNRQKCQ